MGYGGEYRISNINGLVDYELDAVNDKNVDDLKWDKPGGAFKPSMLLWMKIGVGLYK